MLEPEPSLVSVIIPCYNQARFLGEAIGSVLSQSYSLFEIVVVDDGSTDDTFEVAHRYPEVRCVRQTNQGLSAARNAGLDASKSSYLVFFDADDRLLPNALEVGLASLTAHPECAFVYGHLQFIASDGSPLQTPKQVRVETDHCLELLRGDFIWTPGVVMYRRAIFGSVDGFDTRIDACADCDLNIRITRDYPVYCHGSVILEYRQHNASMCRKSALMLKTSLDAHRFQLKYVKGNERYEAASKVGKRAAQDYFGRHLFNEVRAHVASGALRSALADSVLLLRYHPRGLATYVLEVLRGLVSRAKSRLGFFQVSR